MKAIRNFLKASRFAIEIVGLGFIVSMVFLWAFPGAWHGIGLADAARLAATPKNDAALQAPIASADMVAIMLAVATIVLAFVAFAISIAAFFGYSEIRRMAIEAATKEAGKSMNRVQEFIERVESRLEGYTADIERRVSEVIRISREEATQAGGLSEGQGSDAIAQAASGVSPDAGNE